MTIYQATIPVRAGDVVVFDGERHAVRERADGSRGRDRFRVECNGVVTERHIDWFADKAARAGTILIEKEPPSDVGPSPRSGDPCPACGRTASVILGGHPEDKFGDDPCKVASEDYTGGVAYVYHES